ncbi:MAG: pyridoxamine 5'-phosphate oxidase family protein [Frankia sp.]
MTSWTDVTGATPELADAVRQRFEAHGLGLLATLRSDGFPRISGIEPLFDLDELWLGMMAGSLKARDLHRDPRCALHNATVDKDVHDGDVKITGRAVAAAGAVRERYMAAWRDHRGTDVPEPFELFHLDVTELARIRPNVDHLVIESWRVGRGLRVVNRR